MEIIEKIIQLLGLEKTGSPYGIYILLIVFAIGWLLSKSKEVVGWKEIFSKNRLKELEQARDLLKNNEEEAAFYDEAMRQEIFNNLIGIRCRREYREMLQRLVRDGIASTEGVRLAYLFIYDNDSKAEIRFGWLDWIWASILALLGFSGLCGISLSLPDLLLNFNLSTFPNQLLGLSVATLFFFGALKGLLPMAAALFIKNRLKKLEEKNNERAASPSGQIDAAGEQNTAESA